VATFRDEPETWQRLDYNLLQNGSVNLYWRESILNSHLQWLSLNEYRIHDICASKWGNSLECYSALAKSLSFPAHFGHNLDALNDCLSEVDVPESGGAVIVLRGYEKFVQADPDVAQALLEIIAGNARSFLLFGRRLICLVQSSDPRISFRPVEAYAASWNQEEWLQSSRGL
jgi:hypothetical protein